MKAPIATLGMTCLLMAPAVATAQIGPFGARRPGASPAALPNTPAPATDGAGAATAASPAPKTDPNVFPATSVLPAPTPVDEIKPATITLPNDPIEPWLLTRDAGPFMVLARTFRGPEADRCALALAMELRREHGLPAYILRTRDFPMRSNLRGVPPLASRETRKSELGNPEKVRTYDEAAVLVGNEKTLADSEALLHRVKKIRPKCLSEIPSIFNWRQGLSTASRTTNPYVPTQDVFPGRGKRDHLIGQMNSGPRSVFNCPGRYTLQVAEFSGRTMFNPTKNDARLFDKSWLSRSPLITAADDAEKLAETLAKDPEVQRTGCQPYVYHDRSSSKVMIGGFNSPADPNAGKLRETLIKIAIPLADKNKGMVIAPAIQLTDLEDPSAPIKLR